MPTRKIYQWGFAPDEIRSWPGDVAARVEPAVRASDGLHLVHVRAWEAFRSWVGETSELPDAVLYLPSGLDAPADAWLYTDLVLAADQPDLHTRLRDLGSRGDLFDVAARAVEIPDDVLPELRREGHDVAEVLRGWASLDPGAWLDDPVRRRAFEEALRDRLMLRREVLGLDEQEAGDYICGRLRALFEEDVAAFVSRSHAAAEVFQRVAADLGVVAFRAKLQPVSPPDASPLPAGVGPQWALLLAALWALRRRRHASHADVRGEESQPAAGTAARDLLEEGVVRLEQDGYVCRLSVRPDELRVSDVQDPQGRRRRTFWVAISDARAVHAYFLSVGAVVVVPTPITEALLAMGADRFIVGVASDRWYAGT